MRAPRIRFSKSKKLGDVHGKAIGIEVRAFESSGSESIAELVGKDTCAFDRLIIALVISTRDRHLISRFFLVC
jgi:hypothetical protein